jgi:hypothetical protein
VQEEFSLMTNPSLINRWIHCKGTGGKRGLSKALQNQLARSESRSQLHSWGLSLGDTTNQQQGKTRA